MTTGPSNVDSGPNRRRSQRVFLRVPIEVIARGPNGQHTAEDTFTSVVNAHGTIFPLSLKVEVGQKIILKHKDTEEEQPVKVVRTSPAAEGKTDVAAEFLRPAPKFWRVAFPPEDWTPHNPEITADTF
jgi:hypothetical protein